MADNVTSKLMAIYNLSEKGKWQLEEAVQDMCDNYCKWPELIRSMYKDVDEAQKCLEETKCDTCPLNRL